MFRTENALNLSLSLNLPVPSFLKEKLTVCKQKSCKDSFCLLFMQTAPQVSTIFAAHDSALGIALDTQNYFTSLVYPVLEESSCSFLSFWIFSSKSKALPITGMQNYFLCTHITSVASAQHFTRKLCAFTGLQQDSKTPGKCENCPKCLSNIFYTQSKPGKVRKRLPA